MSELLLKCSALYGFLVVGEQSGNLDTACLFSLLLIYVLFCQLVFFIFVVKILVPCCEVVF